MHRIPNKQDLIKNMGAEFFQWKEALREKFFYLKKGVWNVESTLDISDFSSSPIKGPLFLYLFDDFVH